MKYVKLPVKFLSKKILVAVLLLSNKSSLNILLYFVIISSWVSVSNSPDNNCKGVWTIL
jgi:hypothetical protein